MRIPRNSHVEGLIIYLYFNDTPRPIFNWNERLVWSGIRKRLRFAEAGCDVVAGVSRKAEWGS